MRQPQIDSSVSLSCLPIPPATDPPRTIGARWRLVAAAAVLVSVSGAHELFAQAAAEPSREAQASPSGTSATATITPPLSSYVLKDNLVLYLAFEGLDAQADAWKKTAAYRMLNETSLGLMLEDVASQLLDKGMGFLPSRKLTGAELVTLAKHVARRGGVFAFNAGLKGNNPNQFTLVLRDATSTKELRRLTSGLVGMAMGTQSRPKIERKAGRTLVSVQVGTKPEESWAWWPERNDLVITSPSSTVEDVTALVDGKSASAVALPLVTVLAKSEGTFRPLLVGFLDPSACPSKPGVYFADQLARLDSSVGIKRIEYQWGIDDDALMSVARLVAPKPRKSPMTLFEQPVMDATTILPIPEGVDSFVALSASPAKVVEALIKGGPDEIKGQLEEIFEKVKTDSRIDVEKDLLGHMGPRMALYVAPGRSAATSDESTDAPPGASGLDPLAILLSLQSRFPKPTLVAEVDDPAQFGKALDAVMIAVNKELKIQAVEKAVEQEASGANDPGNGQGQGGRRNDSPGQRPARKRQNEVASPEFRLMPGSATVKTYMLAVPPNSPLKIGPPGFKPTVRLEGKLVALSTSADSARLALEVARKKNWAPPADVKTALGHVPSNLMMVALSDPRETLPGLLASLPGTLQTEINSMVALSENLAGGNVPAQPGQGAGMRPGGGGPGGPGMRNNDEGGRGGRSGGGFSRQLAGGGGGGASGGPPPGYPGSSGGGPPSGYPGSSGGGPPPGYPGGSGSGGPGNQGSAGGVRTGDAMVQLKVDPARLPKAEELKALLFPSTTAVTVDDQAIRIVSRKAFPNIFGGLGSGLSTSAFMTPVLAAVRSKVKLGGSEAARADMPGTPASTSGGQPGVGQGAAPGTAPGATPPAGRGGRAGRGRLSDE